MVRHENIPAFLMMIRIAEGTDSEDGYRMMFGKGLFHSFADHPRKAIKKKSGNTHIISTAAGAYQFLSKTWDLCQIKLKLPDFSPKSQDRAAVYLIERRGALGDVVSGRFEEAIDKCNKEWASLPGSPYGQPTLTMAKALAFYRAAGGKVEGDL